jgi:hypothetical protein
MAMTSTTKPLPMSILGLIVSSFSRLMLIHRLCRLHCIRDLRLSSVTAERTAVLWKYHAGVKPNRG